MHVHTDNIIIVQQQIIFIQILLIVYTSVLFSVARADREYQSIDDCNLIALINILQCAGMYSKYLYVIFYLLHTLNYLNI